MAEREPVSGLPKQQEWKVLAVREGKEEPGQKGGMLKKFYVDFDGCDDVYWRRKMPATVEVGQTYYGTISNGDYGPIFKKESPGGAPNGSDAGRSGGRTFKPESDFDPEKVARMGRAHAQGMALQLSAINEPSPSKSKQVTVTDVLALADEFEADVNAAGEKARAAKASQKPPPAPVEQQQSAAPEAVDAVTMRNLCEHAGLEKVPAERLSSFVCERLNPEQQQRAKQGLENDTTATLGRLVKAFEEAEGEPVEPNPKSGSDDDIPF